MRVSSSATAKPAGAVSIAHRDRLTHPPARPTAALIPIDHSACGFVSGPRGVHRAEATPHTTARTTGTTCLVTFMP